MELTPHTDRRRRGYTLVELIVVAVIGMVLLTAATQLLISQSAMVRTQREITDARESIRAASNFIASELREISAADGDLYLTTADSVVMRVTVTGGVACSESWSSGERRLGVQHLSGIAPVVASDSVLAYEQASGSWMTFDLSEAWGQSGAWLAAPTGGGQSVCFWGDSTTAWPRPQAAVAMSGDSATMAGVTVGSPVRVFRKTTIGLFERDGNWWLGRRVSGAFELLAGPMQAPADSGLIVTYLDAAGAPTTTTTDVDRVRVHLRAQSVRTTATGRLATDSTSIVTLLSNN